MMNQKKNSPRKKYLYPLRPFFWRLGTSIEKESHQKTAVVPVFAQGKKRS
ncbi:hypothetical protein [Flagellimonas marinaquae]|nr:hypothetical protein [Allomuricauda aquimarina]